MVFAGELSTAAGKAETGEHFFSFCMSLRTDCRDVPCEVSVPTERLR